MRSALVVGLLCVAGLTEAADVRVSLQPQLITLLDRAVLKVEFVDTQGQKIDIPEVDGLRIDYQGQSRQTQIINMQHTSKVVHTYVITPSRTGDFTIGPIECLYKEGSKSLTEQLRVIPPSEDAQAQQMSEVMFSRISTDRSSPFVHEPFNLKLEVFVRADVEIDGNFSLQGGLPESGMEGVLQWRMAGKRRVERNGSIFDVYMLESEATTLTAGTFEFQPLVQVKRIIRRQDRRPFGFDDPFFGDFFGRQDTRPILLECNNLKVVVRSVPSEGRPESYTGGVGRFDLDVKVGPKEVKTGEPVTIRMRVSGTGNIKQITPPEFEATEDLKCYEARTLPTENPHEVIFEQVVIPTSDRLEEIPPIRFSYFNTKTTDFRTLSKGPFPIEVEAATGPAAQLIVSAPDTLRPETDVLGHDILYLKPLPPAWQMRDASDWTHSDWVKMLSALLPLLLIPATLISMQRSRLDANAALARRQQAPRVARRHLASAREALRKEDHSAFYESMWSALTAYFGHRLNLAPGEVTLKTVADHFVEDRDSIGELFSTVEERRYARSASDSSSQEMQRMLTQLTTILRRCERVKL